MDKLHKYVATLLDGNTAEQKSDNMTSKIISPQNYEQATLPEWLETNGLGGWSSSSIAGCNTRRYHGLLIAATLPPAERMSLVSKLDETIVTGDGRFELGTNNYGQAIHPEGYRFLKDFSREWFPQFIYEAGGVRLKKTIAMVSGENTVTILYEVLGAAQSFTLELLPLLSVRGYHNLSHANGAITQQASFDDHIFRTKAYEGTPPIFIKIPGGLYQPDPHWYYNFNYSIEQYRGLDFTEDLFSHGIFSIAMRQGDTLGIIISTEDPAGRDAQSLQETELARKRSLLEGQPADRLLRRLVLAADQFIVRREEDLKTVIAGYHWFTDWGRDTMIALPGLCLSTGRHEDARKIISAFAKSVSMGMLPNRFQDNGEPPQYNNVDGTLWYFTAVNKYLQATDDNDFVLGAILPVLKEIIDWHFRGTRYHIHVEENGLLFAGEKGQQLTWMDAKVGDWVVTPRMGRPVEIQALWYNALRIFARLLRLNDQSQDGAKVDLNAEKVKETFTRMFWYEEGHYLYDLIDENGNPDPSLRPNQLFAISLPYPLVEGPAAEAILRIVEDRLYTPVGLKSLDAADPRYIPVYGGDTFHRDSAYHQGTVWSWLLGPYMDALIRVRGSAEEAKAVIGRFAYHLDEACIGSVSEIFDADAPHHPRGCVAQAWSVAEILRTIKEYELFQPIDFL